MKERLSRFHYSYGWRLNVLIPAGTEHISTECELENKTDGEKMRD